MPCVTVWCSGLECCVLSSQICVLWIVEAVLWLNMECALDIITSNEGTNEFFSRALIVLSVSGVCGMSEAFSYCYSVVWSGHRLVCCGSQRQNFCLKVGCALDTIFSQWGFPMNFSQCPFLF